MSDGDDGKDDEDDSNDDHNDDNVRAGDHPFDTANGTTLV